MSTTLERLSTRVRSLAERLRTRRDDGPAPDEPATWSCACGQAFRMTGRDRHRVFWPESAGRDEPVLGGRCPSCDRPLPGANAT
jgi:hypothetical protein